MRHRINTLSNLTSHIPKSRSSRTSTRQRQLFTIPSISQRNHAFTSLIHSLLRTEQFTRSQRCGRRLITTRAHSSIFTPGSVTSPAGSLSRSTIANHVTTHIISKLRSVRVTVRSHHQAVQQPPRLPSPPRRLLTNRHPNRIVRLNTPLRFLLDHRLIIHSARKARSTLGTAVNIVRQAHVRFSPIRNTLPVTSASNSSSDKALSRLLTALTRTLGIIQINVRLGKITSPVVQIPPRNTHR